MSEDTPAKFPNLTVLDHPLIKHKLAILREASTPTAMFRRVMREIGLLMGYEVTRGLSLRAKRIVTHHGPLDTQMLNHDSIAVVPILRAGTGLAEGLIELMPFASEGIVGLKRDEETHEAAEYVVRLPEARDRHFFLVDPMIATGHSAAHAIDVLKRHGVAAGRMRFLALVAAPEGIGLLAERHPDVPVIVAALDRGLDANAFIVPGLGDAGDRLYGTEWAMPA